MILLSSSNHAYFLELALREAQKRRGFCAPNPAVGAIVVKDNQVLATGYHFAAGYPHAEVEALKHLDLEQTQGATLYVTLEPCSHYGRTPPCTHLLIEKKINAVYYGYKDPNPMVSGRGAAQLQAAGMICQHIPSPQIDEFYQSYHDWIQYQLPRVTAKLAMSLNGKIAGKNGERITLTGEALQRYTHQWRKQSDAILTTCKTILYDNPQLNIRLNDSCYQKPIYILDRYLTLPSTAQIFDTAEKLTVFYQKEINTFPDYYRQKKVRCVAVEQEDSKLNLQQILKIIGQDGVHDLWLEAGGQCFQSLLLQGLLYRAIIYIAPRWLDDTMQSAFNTGLDLTQFGSIHWEGVGEDVVGLFTKK